VESQAEHLIVQTHGQDKYRALLGRGDPAKMVRISLAVRRGGMGLVNLSRGGQPVAAERFHKNRTLTSFFLLKPGQAVPWRNNHSEYICCISV